MKSSMSRSMNYKQIASYSTTLLTEYASLSTWIEKKSFRDVIHICAPCSYVDVFSFCRTHKHHIQLAMNSNPFTLLQTERNLVSRPQTSQHSKCGKHHSFVCITRTRKPLEVHAHIQTDSQIHSQ